MQSVMLSVQNLSLVLNSINRVNPTLFVVITNREYRATMEEEIIT